MRSPGLRNAFDVHTHLGIVAVFVLLDVEGIKELHGSESKVDLTITEFLMVGNALSMEIDLRSDSSSDASSGGGDSGNDVSRDHLCLVTVSLIDLVVPSTEVRAGMHEVNVEVSVVVLLKISRNVLFRVSSHHGHVHELHSSGFFFGCEVYRGSFNSFSFGRSLTLFLFFRYNYFLVNVVLTLGGSSKLTHLILVTVRFHSLVGCKKVSHAVHILEAHFIISVESNGSGESFGSLPELLAILLSIFREGSDQIPNCEVVISIEHVTCYLHASAHVLLKAHDLENSFEHRFNLVCAGALHFLHEVGGIFFELRGFFQSFSESDTELLTGPLNAMLDHERERLESAHGDSFLRSVLDISVTLSFVGNDHLGVGHHTESSRLQERLLEPLASRVNVKSGLLVIDSIDDEGSLQPEFIVVDIFSGRVDHVLSGINLEVRVVNRSGFGGSNTLGSANVRKTEKELAV